MRRSFRCVSIGLCALVVIAGCNEPFSPKGPFGQKLVVYSVLSPASDTQFVRLYLNYDPPANDPYAVPAERSDTNAQVTISTAAQVFTFHDTLLAPSLRAFVHSSFRPHPGATYILTATSQYGTITATTKMPAAGVIWIPDESTLLFPTSFPLENIGVHVTLASQTRGFLLRFILAFRLQNDSTFRGQAEIPLYYVQDATGTSYPQYPQMQRAVDPHPIVLYPVAAYSTFLSKLGERFKTRVLPEQARFYLVQVDENAYTYYSVVNGFRDDFSIRTDQPDFSNVQNGLGMFGSFNTDSLVIRLWLLPTPSNSERDAHFIH